MINEMTQEGFPKLEDAMNLLKKIPRVHVGDVSQIYHLDDDPYCLSASRRVPAGMVDNNWTQKIEDMELSRLTLLRNPAQFRRLYIPKIIWADKSKSVAAIEWVWGTNLEATPKKDVYGGFEERAQGIAEYISFIATNNDMGRVISDHKPSSLIGIRHIIKGWQYGLVDVSLVNPEMSSTPKNSETLWKIEVGLAGDNNGVRGAGMDETIRSFYKFGLPIDVILSEHPFLIPQAVNKFVKKLKSYDDASQALTEFSAWQEGRSSGLDCNTRELMDFFNNPLVKNDHADSSISKLQLQIRTALLSRMVGRISYSDFQIAEQLFKLNGLIVEYNKNT